MFAGECLATEDPAERIACSAGALFIRYGFTKTNIADIARDCSMSSGNIYRYYKNKHAIGCAIVRRFFTMMELEMNAVADPNPEQALAQLLRAAAARTADMLTRAPLIVELSEALCDAPEGFELLQAHFDECRQIMARHIADGMAQGRFAPGDPAEAAKAAHLCLRGLMAPMIMARFGPETTLKDLETALGLLIGGLRGGMWRAEVEASPPKAK